MGKARLACVLGTVLLCNACATEDALSIATSELDITKFVLPSLTDAERTQIVRQYDQLDPYDMVPRGLLEDAIVYFHVNQANIPRTERFVVIDLSLFSGLDRFWLVDLVDGSVEPHKTSHGSGSDPDNDGYADSFGNVSGSNKSSLGFYLTGEIYDGTHVHSMKLDGLSPDGSPNGMANTNVRARAIVVHEASYVNDDDDATQKQGRSNGCPALDSSIEVSVVDRIHDGSLLYIAQSPLAAPVGRATCGDGVCEGQETATSCAADCASVDWVDESGEEVPGDDLAAGCSTGGGCSPLAALGLLGAMRRRRRGRAELTGSRCPGS